MSAQQLDMPTPFPVEVDHEILLLRDKEMEFVEHTRHDLVVALENFLQVGCL